MPTSRRYNGQLAAGCFVVPFSELFKTQNTPTHDRTKRFFKGGIFLLLYMIYYNIIYIIHNLCYHSEVSGAEAKLHLFYLIFTASAGVNGWDAISCFISNDLENV